MKNYKNYFINLIIPVFVVGAVTGSFTAFFVCLYKFCAGHLIHWSETGYAYLKTHWVWVPVVLAVLAGVAYFLTFIYKRFPDLRGGGIPTSIAALRGAFPIRWIVNLVGVFFLSLSSFLIGVPLGNEGPSVQMGTAVGSGTVRCMAKKHLAWERYSMTGGACAGFSVATGAPISGVLFAVEEAHQRISPMIIMVATTSVMFATLTTKLIAPLFGVNERLFPMMQLPVLELKDIWIPVVVGILVGLFAGAFLTYFKFMNALFTKVLGRMPKTFKILLIFVLTVLVGLLSFSFISTGHELVLELLDARIAISFLLLLLLVRTTLTLMANINGITGGIFLPLLALGAILSAIAANVCVQYFGLPESYYSTIVVLGIVACIAGMMKMPLTAIVFAVEALSCHENLLFVIATAGIAYVVTELFNVKSINDTVIENKIESIHEEQKMQVVELTVRVQKNSFAVGKEVRDIFWPRNVFILSVQHAEEEEESEDTYASGIRTGDILHLHYSTYDDKRTKEELFAIVGEQE